MDENDLAPLLTEVAFLLHDHFKGTLLAPDDRDIEVLRLLAHSNALHLAKYFEVEKLTKALLPHACTSLLLASGVSHYRPNPIHLACNLGRTSCVMLLLQFGAKIHDIHHGLGLFCTVA